VNGPAITVTSSPVAGGPSLEGLTMTPLTATITTFAQIAPTPPAGSPATPATASVSLLLLLGLAAYLMVKTKGAQWPHVGLGVLIGVVGATTVIGSLSWSVINVLIQLVNQVGHSFG
jgi:hypothetical protein